MLGIKMARRLIIFSFFTAFPLNFVNKLSFKVKRRDIDKLTTPSSKYIVPTDKLETILLKQESQGCPSNISIYLARQMLLLLSDNTPVPKLIFRKLGSKNLK